MGAKDTHARRTRLATVMGDPRVCGGLNGGKSCWLCLGLSGLLRVHVRACACDAAGGSARSAVGVSMRACGLPAMCRGRCVIVVVCRHLHCGGMCGGGFPVWRVCHWNFVFVIWCTPHACARAIRAAFRGNSRKFCVKSLARARIERVHYYTKWGYLHIIAKTVGKIAISRGCLVKCQSSLFH